MSTVLEAVNMTAMVLGYVVLFALVTGLVWFLLVRLDAWRYKRDRARQHDRDWDNLRSAWLLEQREAEYAEVIDLADRIETTPFIDVGRIDTDVLNYTVDQIYDYQKEH